jgi:hypothetical protein
MLALPLGSLLGREQLHFKIGVQGVNNWTTEADSKIPAAALGS